MKKRLVEGGRGVKRDVFMRVAGSLKSSQKLNKSKKKRPAVISWVKPTKKRHVQQRPVAFLSYHLSDMELIHDWSPNSTNEELDVFTVESTQPSILETYHLELSSVTSDNLTPGPIEFYYAGSSDKYIDLAATKLSYGKVTCLLYSC